MPGVVKKKAVTSKVAVAKVPKKRTVSRAKKTIKKTKKVSTTPRDIDVDVRIPATVVIEKKSIWYTPLSAEHSIISLASFTIIFASIMLVSFGSHAQPMTASISAVVMATPENSRPPREKNMWEKLDPYQQLSVASGGSLGILLLGAGGLIALSKKKKQLPSTILPA